MMSFELPPLSMKLITDWALHLKCVLNISIILFVPLPPPITSTSAGVSNTDFLRNSAAAFCNNFAIMPSAGAGADFSTVSRLACSSALASSFTSPALKSSFSGTFKLDARGPTASCGTVPSGIPSLTCIDGNARLPFLVAPKEILVNFFFTPSLMAYLPSVPFCASRVP